MKIFNLQSKVNAEHPVFAGKTYPEIKKRADYLRLLHEKFPLAGGIKHSGDYQKLVISFQTFKLAEANFCLVEGQRWEPSPLASLPQFPFREYKEGSIVPLIGGLYIGEHKIDDQLMGKAGLKVVKDPSGKKITFPYFVPWGTRVMMDFTRRNILLFSRAEMNNHQIFFYNEPFIPKSIDDLKPYASYVLPAFETQPDLEHSILEETIKHWHRCKSQLNLETFVKRFFPLFGQELILRELIKEDLARALPSCSLQFKGAGGNYFGRIVNLNKNGTIPLKEGEKILGNQDHFKGLGPRKIVGFPNLQDQFGIFLDHIHQPPPCSPDPVGGMIKADAQAIDLDRQLLSNGAVMAAISISAIKLLEERTIREVFGLSSYQSGDLYILARAALQDTRRLMHIKDSDLYPIYIQEKQLDFEKGREEHLLELCQTLGKNMRAVLFCKRGAKGPPGRPETGNNLSPTGAIFDSTELVPANTLDPIFRLIFFWLEDLFEIVKSSGLGIEPFIKDQRFLEALMRNLFDRELMFNSQPWGKFCEDPSPPPQKIAFLILENWEKAYPTYINFLESPMNSDFSDQGFSFSTVNQLPADF